jgi:Fe-S-cluster containining protein
MSQPEDQKVRMRAHWPGDKPVGSVTTYLRKLHQGAVRGQVDVPCGSCNACCRSAHIHADLLPHELKDFPDAVPISDLIGSPESSGFALPKNADGSCSRLIDGKCSIYPRRPLSCRVYDCRIDLLIGMTDDDPIMQEAIAQWKGLEFKTREDRLYLTAARLAVMDHGFPKNHGEAMQKLTRLRDFLPLAERIGHMMEALSPTEREEFGAAAQKMLQEQFGLPPKPEKTK